MELYVYKIIKIKEVFYEDDSWEPRSLKDG